MLRRSPGRLDAVHASWKLVTISESFGSLCCLFIDKSWQICCLLRQILETTGASDNATDQTRLSCQPGLLPPRPVLHQNCRLAAEHRVHADSLFSLRKTALCQCYTSFQLYQIQNSNHGHRFRPSDKQRLWPPRLHSTLCSSATMETHLLISALLTSPLAASLRREPPAHVHGGKSLPPTHKSADASFRFMALRRTSSLGLHACWISGKAFCVSCALLVFF
jgi:hypothetical protein